MALSKTTQDHDEIRQWAEARGGKPSEVASTERNGQTGIIRIEFPGAVNANDSNLKEISWDEFFEKFDSSGLALVYQEQTAEGAESNFNRFVHPENVSASAKKSSKKAPATKGAKRSGSVKGAASAKKAAAPAKKAAAPAKKSTVAKKAVSAREAESAKKTSVKKSAAKTPAKKAVPAKTSAAKKTAAKKASSKKSTGQKGGRR